MDIRLVRSVRSHGASLGCVAFSLADSFLANFFRSCPHLRRPLTRGRKNPTRTFALRWAWFVRNFGRLDTVQPQIEAFAHDLARRGMTPGDFHAVRSAFLAATREVSGTTWNHTLESDWSAAFDTIANRMGATAAPLALAA